MKIKKIILSVFILGIAVGIGTCFNAVKVQALSDTIKITVSISFDYEEFQPVTLHLYRQLEDQDDVEVIETCQATEPVVTFNDLERSCEGGEYHYGVIQEEISGYQTTYEQDENQISILNSLVMMGLLDLPEAKIDLLNGTVPVAGNYPDFEIESLLTTPGGETVELVNFVNPNGEVIINGGMSYQINQPGLYVLTLNQKIPDYQNFTFDKSQYTVEYQVEYAGSPDLEIHQGPITNDENIVTAIRYQNVYHSNTTWVAINPVVAINGFNPMAETFKISVFDVLPFGEFLNSELTIAYPESDNCSFNFEMYPDTEYEVNIRQVANDSPYYSYDQSNFNVKVMTDSYGISTKTIFKDGVGQKKVEFENSYVPVPGESLIQIYKEVEGGDPHQNPSFSFRLSEISDNASITIKNDNLTIKTQGSTIETGAFNLNFNQPGEYVFRLNEVAGEYPDYVYDDSVYLVEALVSDCEGYLKVNYRYYQNNILTDRIVFKNIYIEPLNWIIVDTSDHNSYIYEHIPLEFGVITLAIFVYKKIKAVT